MIMPPLKCCKKTWSVGSDDFVLSSVVGIIFHTVWSVSINTSLAIAISYM